MAGQNHTELLQLPLNPNAHENGAPLERLLSGEGVALAGIGRGETPRSRIRANCTIDVGGRDEPAPGLAA